MDIKVCSLCNGVGIIRSRSFLTAIDKDEHKSCPNCNYNACYKCFGKRVIIGTNGLQPCASCLFFKCNNCFDSKFRWVKDNLVPCGCGCKTCSNTGKLTLSGTTTVHDCRKCAKPGDCKYPQKCDCLFCTDIKLLYKRSDALLVASKKRIKY